MSDPAKIEKALRAAFFAAIPTAANLTALENQSFDPAGKAKWYIFSFVPNVPEVATLGEIGQDAFTGFAQVDINIPEGSGKGNVDADFQTLRLALKAGTRLDYEGVGVTITSAGKSGSGRKVNGFHRTTFTILWQSRVSR
jgi:hypothetical protein